jgi:hypothetical protein
MSTYDKGSWRQRNLDCLKAQPSLWSSDGRHLTCTCVDFLDESGHLTYELLRRHLPHPNAFIGVEHNADTAMRVALQNTSRRGKPAAPRFRMIFGDAYDIVRTLLRDGEPVGYLSCDTLNAVNPSWWHRHADVLREIVDHATRALPTFVLVLNHTISRGGAPGTTSIERLRTHARDIVTTFGKWRIRESALVGQATEIPTVSKGEHRLVGGFEIYCSADHVLRMATVRLVFSRAKLGADVYLPRAGT